MNVNSTLTLAEKLLKLIPVRKVATTGIASAVTTILIWIFSEVPPHLEIPGEVAAAITTVIGFIFGWLIPEKSTENEVP